MGQIIFSRNPTGSIALGLFILGISAFLFSVLDPLFGPLALGCIAAGAVVATLLLRRHPKTPHIDRQSVGEDVPRPIQPR